MTLRLAGILCLLAASACAQPAPAPSPSLIAPAPSPSTPLQSAATPQRPCERALVLPWGGRSINRGTADWAIAAIDAANDDPTVCAVVLELSATDGDLMSASALVTAIALSGAPVAMLVGPGEAEVSSGAALLVAQSAHVLAIAPGARFGDAGVAIRTLPSSLGGPGAGDRDAMIERATDDLVKAVRELAELRGRSPDWAEAAVREGATVTADDATAVGAVDLVASDAGSLLLLADGRAVITAGQRTRLGTAGARLDGWPMTRTHKVLAVLASPSLAFVFLVAGLAGLWLEYQTPGLWVPGVLGGLCLLLFGFSMSIIPVNLLAVVLVLAGFGMIVADLYVTSFATLTLAGVAAVALGGLFLIDESPDFAVGVSPGVIVGVVLVVLLLAAVVGALFVADRTRPIHGGAEGMIGARGTVKASIGGGREAGAVLVHGERWAALAAGRIPAGAAIVVESVDGLVLTVRKED